MYYRIIYMTTNNVNRRKYIGKHTCTDLNDGYYGSSDELIEDIQVLGKHNFERVILDYAETDEELSAKESYYLRKNKVVESAEYYNQSYSSSGGNPFENWTQERYEQYIELQRKVQAGKKRSQKTKDRISKNNVGFKGKTHTDESKAKTSEFAMNQVVTDEARRKLSEINFGGGNPNSKAILLLNKKLDVIKKFDAKYMAEYWFHEEGYSNTKRMARNILASYFKSKELWNDQLYFVLEREYESFLMDKISS